MIFFLGNSLLLYLIFKTFRQRAKKLPDIIITNIHKKYTGITTTIINLYPEHAKEFNIGLYGESINVNEKIVNFIDFIFFGYKLSNNIKYRLLHVRRNNEIIFGIFIRDILRLPIKILLTEPKTTKHSFFSKILIKQVDYIIVTHKKCIKILPDKQKVIAVIPHGVKCNNNIINKIIYDFKNKFVVSTFGRVRKQKGTHIFVMSLIKIMHKYPDLIGVIVGLTDIRHYFFKNNLINLIKKNNLSDRIIFTGFVDKQTKDFIYKNTTLSICVPIREEFGLTPIESFSNGVPVICSDTGAFDIMIDEYKTGNIIPVNNVDLLSEKIEYYLNNKEKISTMKYFCLDKYKNNFKVEIEANKINNIYKKLLY